MQARSTWRVGEPFMRPLEVRGGEVLGLAVEMTKNGCHHSGHEEESREKPGKTT